MTNEMLQAYLSTGLMPQAIYQMLAWQIILGIGLLIMFSFTLVWCFITAKQKTDFQGMYIIIGSLLVIGDLVTLGILFKILTAPQLYLMHNWEKLVH